MAVQNDNCKLSFREAQSSLVFLDLQSLHVWSGSFRSLSTARLILPESSHASPTVSDSKMLIHFSRLRHASLSVESFPSKMESFPFVSSEGFFFFWSTNTIKSSFVTPTIFSLWPRPHSQDPLHPPCYRKPTDQQKSVPCQSPSRDRAPENLLCKFAADVTPQLQ